MNLTNQALTNVFSKALIANSTAPRYARASFTELVKDTLSTKNIQRAIKAANALFGTATEDKVIKHRVRKVKHAKKLAVKSPKVARDPNAPKRGRPKGSKNKPKVEVLAAESRPMVDPAEEVIDTPAITLES